MSTVVVIVALLAVATAAWAWHAVTEHHFHLVVLSKVRPGVIIPPTSHDTRWHAMSHGQRAAVNALLLAAAVALGVAWQLDRTATAAAVVVLAAGAVAAAAARGAARAIGARHQPGPENLED